MRVAGQNGRRDDLAHIEVVQLSQPLLTRLLHGTADLIQVSEFMEPEYESRLSVLLRKTGPTKQHRQHRQTYIVRRATRQRAGGRQQTARSLAKCVQLAQSGADVVRKRWHETASRRAELLQKPAKVAEKKEAASVAASAPIPPTTAIHAASLLDQFSRQLHDTHRYHEGYDPKYTWWAAKPFESAKQAIADHRKAIREKLAGLNDNDVDKIVGLPIGNEALTNELRHAWIPYTAQELIDIGERELKWCDDRFTEAANDLKLDGNASKAIESVKSLHVEPGDQPRLIRELAWEAIRFVEGNDLITIPEMAKHGWRMEMMTPEAQRMNPYFLGGNNIIVSFPTNTMTHSEKLMSLKSNNIHFCRATVHHELIPGHHLQYYSLARFRPYRELFSSPFWMEGWALYWEMQLWDMGFAQSPEDRVGMLFWRRHRAARILFSLNYQLGKWSAEECVKYLIDRVGHEPSAAAAEVRRSIMGAYGPLYQAGYMLGGLQLRSLHKEMVQSGKMTNRDFHDAILRENYIPFELLRAKLLMMPLLQDQTPSWKFYER